MIFLTPKQNQQRNAIVLVLDFAILKDILRGFADGDDVNIIWRGILHDFILKLTCLAEYATCFWTIEQSHRFTTEEKNFFGRMLGNWEKLELDSTESALSLARRLKEERNFKQATFISSLVPSIPPVVISDAQEWLWEVEFVLGSDTDSSLYMLALRLSEVREIDKFRWQDNRLFINLVESVRSNGKLAQPIFFWKQIKSLGDLEHYYQFFAAISGINPKYNGFDGFHTWEAINQVTAGQNLSRCEKFLKAQMANIEEQKKKLEQSMKANNTNILNRENLDVKSTKPKIDEESDDYPQDIKIKPRKNTDISIDYRISKSSQNREGKAPKLGTDLKKRESKENEKE